MHKTSKHCTPKDKTCKIIWRLRDSGKNWGWKAEISLLGEEVNSKIHLSSIISSEFVITARNSIISKHEDWF